MQRVAKEVAGRQSSRSVVTAVGGDVRASQRAAAFSPLTRAEVLTVRVSMCVRKGYNQKNAKPSKKAAAHTAHQSSRPASAQRPNAKNIKTRHITSHMTMRTATSGRCAHDIGRRIMVLVTVSRSEREAPTGHCDANISTSGHFNK